jgi:hypothetical protein
MASRLVFSERTGFNITLMTCTGVSASRAPPDTQLLYYGEMADSARTITPSLQATPCIGDGDTGNGGPMDVERTMRGYAAAGLAGIMIEDQVSPKRRGHTKDKDVGAFGDFFLQSGSASPGLSPSRATRPRPDYYCAYGRRRASGNGRSHSAVLRVSRGSRAV